MRRLMFALACLIAFVAPVSGQTSLSIDLNIPELKLTVREGDRLLETYPVAVGMPGFDTPTGSFAITHAEWNPWWTPPTNRAWARDEVRTPPGPNNPMGRVKLFFMPLYFIHGTPDGESIGTPASHGCVRMRNSDVIQLARIIHERVAPNVSAAELSRLVARPGATRRVNFQDSVSVVIRYDPVVVQGSEILTYPDIYRRNAIHTEAVYQALMAAGYDVSNVDLATVRRYVDRVKGQRVPVVTKLDEVFGSSLSRRAA